MSPTTLPPIALFGYYSSPFTQKIRICLRLLQIPHTFVLVPSMMPRPILVDNFNLTYRKIPVLAIGRDVIVDTSLIVEYLHAHPALRTWREERNGNSEYSGEEFHHDARSRTLARIFSSFFTDRPLFRLTTGLIPSVVWRTKFGEDRGPLIGHKLDPDKLEKKVPRNLVALDTYLSILEPAFANAESEWVLGTEKPSLADVSLFYQLDWGDKISRGIGIEDLTGGEAGDRTVEGMRQVFTDQRYPGLWNWFHRFQDHVDRLPVVERTVGQDDLAGVEDIMRQLDDAPSRDDILSLPTPNNRLEDLEERNGLGTGAKVSIAPDDTGRGNPTIGKLVALNPEEVVIEPHLSDAINGNAKSPRVGGVRLHFPRVGFIVTLLRDSKL